MPVRDGHGAMLITSIQTSAVFNYGQSRTFASEPYGFAVSTSSGSAGWMPPASIKGRTSFERKLVHVSAKVDGR